MPAPLAVLSIFADAPWRTTVSLTPLCTSSFIELPLEKADSLPSGAVCYLQSEPYPSCSPLFVILRSAAICSVAHLRSALSAGAKLQQTPASTPMGETGSGHQAAKRQKSATPKAEAPPGTGDALRPAACLGVSCCLPLYISRPVLKQVKHCSRRPVTSRGYTHGRQTSSVHGMLRAMCAFCGAASLAFSWLRAKWLKCQLCTA